MSNFIFELQDTEKASELFNGWPETMIWSCLQKVMGSIFADDLDSPKSAMAFLGDFCFLAGAPMKELVSYKPNSRNDSFIMVPQDETWADLISHCYGNKAKRITRYAIKKETDVFDTKKLLSAVNSLPSDYSLMMIDEKIFNLCKNNDWSYDLVSQYAGYEKYNKLGLGVVVFKDGNLVSGASSYTRYKNGIEIEIDTKKEYRKKGLAYACGAKLILECLKRGLYPSWDAHNLASVALAEKLGYHFSHEYTAYEIENNG